MTDTDSRPNKRKLNRARAEKDEVSKSNGSRLSAIADRLKAISKKSVLAFKNALYPEDVTCDVCGNELVADTRYRLCADCAEKLPTTGDHVCLVCGAPIDNEADYCIRCQNTESVYKLNRSPLAYEGIAKDLIHMLKFGGKKYIVGTLGAMMSDTFIKNRMDGEIIVFVPMSDSEYKRRGFNQAELLANEVGKRLNIPVLPALRKIKETSAQKELGGKERRENLKGAFICVFDEIKGRKILLIDDVFTTGATANECASVLLRAKAKEVSVLTAAVTKQKIFMD